MNYEFLTDKDISYFTELGLTERQIKILDLLKSWYYTRGKEEGTFTVSASQLNAELGASVKTVQRELTALEAKQILLRKLCKVKGVQHNTNSYRIPYFIEQYRKFRDVQLNDQVDVQVNDQVETLVNKGDAEVLVSGSDQVPDHSISLSVSNSISNNNKLNSNLKVMEDMTKYFVQKDSVSYATPYYQTTLFFNSVEDLKVKIMELQALFSSLPFVGAVQTNHTQDQLKEDIGRDLLTSEQTNSSTPLEGETEDTPTEEVKTDQNTVLGKGNETVQGTVQDTDQSTVKDTVQSSKGIDQRSDQNEGASTVQPPSQSERAEFNKNFGEVMEDLKNATKRVWQLQDNQGSLLEMTKDNEYGRRKVNATDWYKRNKERMTPKQQQVISEVIDKYSDALERKRKHIHDFLNGKLGKDKQGDDEKPKSTEKKFKNLMLKIDSLLKEKKLYDEEGKPLGEYLDEIKGILSKNDELKYGGYGNFLDFYQQQYNELLHNSDNDFSDGEFIFGSSVF